MNDTTPQSVTAFSGLRRIASGRSPDVALAVKHALEADPWATILIFNDLTSERIEFDLRGTDTEVIRRLEAEAVTAESSAPLSSEPAEGSTNTGPGRPKLGVVAREVTLLPRHWEWLNQQPGGASVVLRKLVEEARRAAAEKDRIRQSQEACYRFLSAIAGNLPHFEEVSRALFAGDGERFDMLTESWSPDVREYARKLATIAFGRGETE